MPVDEGPPSTFSGRDRSIDHGKRLFSTLMGLAATVCVVNAYLAARTMGFQLLPTSLFAAEALALLALLLPYYLIAEQYLDNKYLIERVTPHVSEYLLDLVTPLAMSCVFIIVASTFPASAPAAGEGLHPHHRVFAIGVSVIAGLDLLSMIVHTALTSGEGGTGSFWPRHLGNVWKLLASGGFFFAVALGIALFAICESNDAVMLILSIALAVLAIIRAPLEIARYGSPLFYTRGA